MKCRAHTGFIAAFLDERGGHGITGERSDYRHIVPLRNARGAELDDRRYNSIIGIIGAHGAFIRGPVTVYDLKLMAQLIHDERVNGIAVIALNRRDNCILISAHYLGAAGQRRRESQRPGPGGVIECTG